MFLILGKSANFKLINHITHIESLDELHNIYGYTGSLVEACEDAFKWNASNFYVCNLHSYDDYFDIIPQIKALSVDYIVPIDKDIKKMITLKDGRSSPLFIVLNDYLKYFTFILTSPYCDDFSCFNDFLSYCNNEVAYYKSLALLPQNIVYVANHLKDSIYANVACVCALLNAPIGHPSLLECGATVIDLEKEDFFYPTVFFKNQLAHYMFNLSFGLKSNLYVQHMLRIVKNELDVLLMDYAGKKFLPHTLMHVEQKASRHLMKRKQYYYRRYNITNIYFQETDICIDLDVWPFNSFDSIATTFIFEGV